MEVQYAGCDWLTMTSKDDKVGQDWYALYRRYKQQKYKEGDEESTFHNGWYGGLRIAQMSVGHSEDIGHIVIVSGSDAERLYNRLSPAKHKVTRLDLCFDFSFTEPRNIGSDLYTRLKINNFQKQRKFSLITNSDGGETLYLGSRQSMQFGRIYDKGVQSKTREPGLLWRAEVEYKKPKSGSIAKGLDSISPEDRAVVISDTVAEWFGERYAEIFPKGMIQKPLHLAVERRTTTANKKLGWLRTQVAPTVKQLIELGYGRDILDSLLLDEKALNRCMID